MSDDSNKDLTANQMAAVVALAPEFNAAFAAAHFLAGARGGDASTFDMCMHLAQEAKAVQGGDLRGLEAMLTAQAHALDVMFTSLAAKAGRQLEAGLQKEAESHLRLALKAQWQCRTTIEAINGIKNPEGVKSAKPQRSAHGGDFRKETT